MKRILLLTAFFLGLSSSGAHAESDVKDYQTYLTAERAYDVHAQESPASPVVSKIKPGDAVFIADRGPNVGDGYNQIAWYKITHGPDGAAGAGYILTDLFLQNNSLTHGTTRFVCERKLDKKHNLATITLKAFDKNGKLQSISEPVTTIFADLLQLEPVADHGLSDVQLIIHLYTSGEACGIPDCSYYYAWTGTDLALLPTAISLGGAGMDVIYDEALVFPDGGAPADTIIKVIKATEYFNESEEDYRVKGERYAAQVYLWNGKRVAPQSPEPKLFNWFDDYLKTPR